MIKYQQEFIDSVKSDILPLLHLDWLEIEHQKDIREFDPDWETYEALEQAGILKVFTVRSEGKLVGYYSCVVSPSLHSRGLLQAAVDAIYLHPDYRKGLTGYKLIKFAEKCLKEDNVKIILLGTTEVNPIDPLLLKLGYSKTEAKFEKVL